MSPTLFLLLVVLLAGCGKRGAPLPPLLRIPGAVGEPTATRIGDEVFVRFTIPKANADGVAPANIARVEVYAITADRAPMAEDDPEELRRQSTLIGTEQVRKPLPPLPPPKAGEPEPPPIPQAPGSDQGGVVVVREHLNDAARVPVTLPSLERPRRIDVVEVKPLPGPLVAPLESKGPMRYYYAVGVSPSGRYGPAQPFMPIPLGTVSSAPSSPALAHTETTLTITWTPPADARGVQPPPLPDALPSKPVPPQVPPTTYDVYEVRRDPPTNQSASTPTANKTPSMPTPLTAAPIAALEFTQPVTAFGIERCFFVRPVDIVDGIHVRGPASSIECIMLEDFFPPAPPQSLAAVASGGAINLIWEPSPASDLAGYLVLRGEAGGATLTPRAPAPISETTFVDRDVRSGVTYIYAVVAVDKAGNRSGESNRVEETSRQ